MLTSLNQKVAHLSDMLSHSDRFEPIKNIDYPNVETQTNLNSNFAPLLTTKLYVPPPRPNLVGRSRLIKNLEDGLRLGCKLTLICAPAGFGKTTLVAEWLHKQTQSQAQQPANQETPGVDTPSQIAWFSLDEEDNDPIRFLTYLVAALQMLDSSVGRGLLQSRQLPPTDVLVTLLINDLATIPNAFALVLDDYHLIQTPAIHEIVDALLEHQPPHMHLVMTSREDPPLPLSRMRVRGQMIEVRQEDLKFTPEESITFFDQSMGLNLTDQAVAVLEERTEGWVAGLQLAALSLQGRTTEKVDSFIEAFSGSHRYVIDYLVEEVIQQQPEDVRQFLIQTAILDRLSAPLCDVVTGRNDSKGILEMLEHANLFLIPLDDHRAWYRYHHLFVEFLRTELDAEQQAPLHQKASEWFEESGLVQEAIKHALAAKDIPKAGRLIEFAAAGLLHNGEFMILLNWLEALPEDHLRTSSELSTYMGWVLWLSGQMEAADSYTQSARVTLPNTASQESRGKLKSLQACQALTKGIEGLKLAEEALSLLDDRHSFFKGMTLLVFSDAQNIFGDTVGAILTLREMLRLAQLNDDRFMMVSAQVNLAQQLNWLGKRREAADLCHQAIEQCLDARGNPLPLAGLPYISLGELEYWANNLVEAEQYIQKGIVLIEQLGLLGGDITGKLTMTQLLSVSGKLDEALRSAQEIYQSVIDNNFDAYANICFALVANIQLELNDMEAAEVWAKTVKIPDSNTFSPFVEYEYIIYAKYLLKTKQASEAEKLLTRLKHSAENAQRNLMSILISLLQTDVYASLNRNDDALAALEHAVHLAAPENYIQPFLNLGKCVSSLLPQAHHISPNFVDTVLDALKTPQDILNTPSKHSEQAGINQSLIEPLSDREIEVLQLVATGQSNREISENLFVTLGTVKKHLNNIYGKLGVKSRTQAVARARQINLID